mgnify:CR=1 FL=1
MKKYCVGAVGLVVVCLALIAAQAQAADADFLNLIPDEAAIVVAAKSANAYRTGLESFLNQIEPSAYASMGDPLSTFISDTGDGGGLDTEAPVGMALIFKAKDAAAGMGGGADVTMVFLVPVSNIETWRNSWSGAIGKDEDGVYEYLEGFYGGRTYFVEKGAYIVFGDNVDAIGRYGKSVEAAVSGARRDSLAKALSGGTIVANVSVAGLRKSYPTLGADMERTIAMMGAMMLPGQGEKGAAIADTYSRIAQDMLSGIDEIYAAATVDASGIMIKAELQAAEGSVIYNIISQQAKVDIEGLYAMPAGSAFAGCGGVQGDAAWDYLGDIYKKLMSGMADTPEEAEKIGQEAASAIEKFRAAGLGQSAAFAILPGTDKLFTTVAAHKTADATKALDTFVDTMANDNFNIVGLKMMAASGIKAGPIEVTDETIDSTPVKVMSQALDLTNTPEMQQQMFKKMFGDKIVTRLAAKGDMLYISVNDDGSALAKMLSGADRIDAEKVKRSLPGGADGATGAMVVSVGDYMAWIFSIAPMPGGNVGSYVVPATDKYLAVRTSVSGGTARMIVTIPTEQILAGKNVLGQMMSQRMQGAPEDAIEWDEEDEGDDSAADE